MYSRSHVIVLAYSWLHLLAPKFRSNADHKQWASTDVHTIDGFILCNLAMMGLQLSRPEGMGNHRYKQTECVCTLLTNNFVVAFAETSKC